MQVMQSVIIRNDALEHDGQAGYVVEAVTPTDEKISVKMDSDGQVYEFDRADVVAL